MRASIVSTLVLAWLTALPAAGSAGAAVDDSTTPLSLQSVLESSARHYPLVIAALAERQAVAREVDARRGDFDVVFDVSNFNRVDGFYDGRAVEAKATRPLGAWGTELYGSYALSRGEFPIYEDEYYTNTGGKLKVGVLFSLLRDRAIDDRRFELNDARLALEAADLELQMTKIGVQRLAIEAYWRWVFAGSKQVVYDELLAIALERDRGLTDQVARGALAEIFLTENQRNITRRRSRSIAAQAELTRAANRLGLYYRDAAGMPQTPSPQQLPVIGSLTLSPPEQPGALQDTISMQPELRQLRVAAQRARQKLSLSENALKPKLDFGVEVGTPFGDVGEGGASRDSTDAIVGLTFSVPLARRTAKAEVEQSRLELRAIEERQRQTNDRLQLEITEILIELKLARELAELAQQEVELAAALVQAETRRFEEGASDFFLVNLREETAAGARIEALAAALRQRLARAEYDAAALDFNRLGLTPRATAVQVRSPAQLPDGR
jgi:outer membrane protein TolC